jgi:hypothetical protein
MGSINGRMGGIGIDDCASSNPKKPQCDSNSLLGLGRDAGPDRLTWGGDHTFFGVGVAVGTQLSIGRSLTLATRGFGVYSTLCHTVVGYGRSPVNISSRANRALGEHRRPGRFVVHGSFILKSLIYG